MGFADAFPYRGPADIFREHARLSGFENGGTRAFDISALSDVSDADYEVLAPIQWPVKASGGTPRLFGDGLFPMPSGRARFVASAPPVPAKRQGAFPLTLNSGRLRDQWHTMTRTGLSPVLGANAPEPPRLKFTRRMPVPPASRKAGSMSSPVWPRRIRRLTSTLLHRRPTRRASGSRCAMSRAGRFARQG